MSLKTGFNINKIQGDGYLIIPISMSRISAGQTPEDCYEQVKYFTDKLTKFSSEVIFIYTNGLYFNSTDISYETRQKMNAQVLNHSIRLRKIINEDRKFVIHSFHFIPVDYFILNSFEYLEMFSKLKKVVSENKLFADLLKEDMKGREFTEANINFILEELVVEHLIREQFVDLPKVLVKYEEWRIFSYPGSYFKTDAYIVQNKLLEKNKKCTNYYRDIVYDFTSKTMTNLSEVNINLEK